MNFLQTLALRSNRPYKILLNLLPINTPVLDKMPKVDINLVSLCGVKHSNYLRESLISLVNNWKSLPNIKIFSDGTISIDELKSKFKWLGKHAEFFHWQDCLKELDPEKDKSIIQYAQKHIMGVKFATIITNARKYPTLWCDSDVLWYGDFSYTRHQGDFYLKASRDYQQSYSKDLISFSPLLNKPPFVCAGFLLLNGDLTKVIDLNQMLAVALSNPDHFSEQTMIAYSTLITGANLWDKEEIACFDSDRYTFKPSFVNKNWIARHYVSPVRHLFWRDAFFYRLGLRP